MKRETGAVSRKSSCLERYFRFPEIHDLNESPAGKKRDKYLGGTREETQKI